MNSLFSRVLKQILVNQRNILGSLGKAYNDSTRDLIQEMNNAVEQQKTDREKTRDLLVQVDAFLRSWQPDDRGPMAKQFGKMIEEVQEFLVKNDEEGIL